MILLKIWATLRLMPPSSAAVIKNCWLKHVAKRLLQQAFRQTRIKLGDRILEHRSASVVPINTDGVCDMTGLACIQHHMQQADGLCGTTLQLQSQYEWKFYAQWHGHETVGKDSKAVRPSNI